MNATRGLTAAAAAIALALAGCNGGGGDGDGGGGGGAPADDISMVTPYVSESDMGPINEAYSESANSPWGFEHRGVDFFGRGHLSPFRAVASGVIEQVGLNENEGSGNWQVSVMMRHNATYRVLYVFEPMTSDERDGQTQLGEIAVTVGQAVAQGELIGDLLRPVDGAHVHFGLFQEGADAVCPAPFFTQEARDSITGLIREQWRGADMCYFN